MLVSEPCWAAIGDLRRMERRCRRWRPCCHAAAVAAWLLLAMAAGSSRVMGATPLAPAIFILGDSLADPGNNNYIPLAVAKANFPYNGIDFSLGATGRFCNGRTAFDIIATDLGLPYPPPYLAPAVRSGNNIILGVNYASAAAGILDSTGYNYAERVPLSKQLKFVERNTIPALLNNYLAGDRQRLQAYLGTAIWSVIIGSNDYINNYLLVSSPLRNVPPQQYQQLLVSTFRGQLQKLRSLGARKVVVAGVGPLGCIPSQLARNPQTEGGCVARVNQLVLDFNAAVKGMLQDLNALYNDTTFVYSNTYDTVYDLVNEPAVTAANGFQVTNVGCCGSGPYNGITPCANFLGANVCADRSKYIFWDAFHPTDAVNVIIADQIFGGGPEVVSPINVRQLAAI